MTDVEKFLSDRPLDVMREGRYKQRPILTGYASMEELFFIYRYANDASKMATNFSDFLPTDIVGRYLNQQSTEMKSQIKSKISISLLER